MATAADLEIYYAKREGTSDNEAPTSGTASGGSKTTIIDAARTESDGWAGAVGEFTGGSNDGDFFHVTSSVSGTLTTTQEFANAVLSGDTYRIFTGGNYRSNLRVPGLTGTSGIAGVTVVHIPYMTGTGNATVTYEYGGGTARTLTFTAPSGTAGSSVSVETGGTFDLFDDDDDKFLTVNVGTASLGTVDGTDTLAITMPENVFVADVEGTESTEGKIRHRLAIVKNTHASDSLVDVTTYNAKSNSAAVNMKTDGTLAESGTSTETLTGTAAFTGWPSSGWVLNTSKDDCRPFYNCSGSTMTVYAMDWVRLDYDNGTTEISVGDTLTGSASSAEGTVMAISETTGTWDGGATGLIYLKNCEGTFTNNEDIQVSGTTLALAASAGTRGYRDKDGTTWASADTIELMPEFDTGWDAPSSNQYEDITAETTAPAGVVFSCGTSLGSGTSCGDLAASAAYGLWVRDWTVDGARSRPDIISRIRFGMDV